MNKKEIFSIIRSNREDDLKEWVDYHLAIGFDKISILDDNSTFSIAKLFSNYKNIEIIDKRITSSLEQNITEIYRDISKEKEKERNYIAFIDNDEYIYIKNKKRIGDILNKNIAVLCLYWKHLSSLEPLEKRTGTVIETFNYTCNPGGLHMKSIINFNICKNVQWDTDGPHLPRADDFLIETTSGSIVKNRKGPLYVTPSFYDTQEAYIYHYFYQTQEDWNFKAEKRPNLRVNNSFKRRGSYHILDNSMIERKRELGI